MTLINIEYGSLANSDTMNKNFSYLDERISEISESTTSLISSILSNIATINSRLGDLSEEVQENSATCTSQMENYKNKTIDLLNKATVVPQWKSCIELSEEEKVNYKVPANGYLLLLPKTASKGNLVVNDVTVILKARVNADDNSSQLYCIPVKAGDVVNSTVAFNLGYFLPAIEFTKEDFN